MRPTGFVGVVVFTGVFGVDFTLRTTGSRAHGFERAFAIGALMFWTREAQSAFVSRAAAFAASMHSRAVVSVVALRFERALTISALDTRSSKRFCVSCCRIRCIRFENIRLPSVLIRRTCYTRGICTVLVSVYAQVLCNNWRTRCGRCGAIGNHNECRPCGKIIA